MFSILYAVKGNNRLVLKWWRLFRSQIQQICWMTVMILKPGVKENGVASLKSWSRLNKQISKSAPPP